MCEQCADIGDGDIFRLLLPTVVAPPYEYRTPNGLITVRTRQQVSPSIPQEESEILKLIQKKTTPSHILFQRIVKATSWTA